MNLDDIKKEILEEELKKYIKEGKNPSEAARLAIKRFNLDSKFDTVRYYARKCKYDLYGKKEITEDEKLLQLLKTGVAFVDLCKELGCGEADVNCKIDKLREKGYLVDDTGGMLHLKKVFKNEAETHDAKWKGTSTIRFGLLGDTHLGSKYTQLTYLNIAYDRFAQDNIACVYHTGDICEGDQMRQGHQYECYKIGSDEHVDELIKNYPKRRGIKTYFITGNHDLSFVKRQGLDIGRLLAKEREDMVYLGQSQAFVDLTPKCKLELRHPAGGVAYAISYKPQKFVDAMPGGKKPNIFACGHYHKAEYIFYRNVHCFQTGTTQAQTPFLRGLGASVHMGFWVIEIEVSDLGQINKINQTFYPFYEEIPDDYKNYF